jgi:hypothetical protein
MIPVTFSSSLNTCDQVRNFKDFSLNDVAFGYPAARRRWHKNILAVVLNKCCQQAEALAVEKCCVDFRVGKLVDCGSTSAFPITCDHRFCPSCCHEREMKR